MHLILPIETMAHTLYERNQYYTRLYEVQTLDFPQSLILTHWLAEYLINDRLYWTQPADFHYQLDQHLLSWLDWWVEEGTKQPLTDQTIHCERYYSTVIDPQECALRALIDETIPDEERWRLWSTIALHHDLVLCRGEDYRIVEFERHVLANTLSVNERVKHHISSTHQS